MQREEFTVASESKPLEPGSSDVSSAKASSSSAGNCSFTSATLSQTR